MEMEIRSASNTQMNKRYIIFTVLIIYTFIIFLPPVVYGYVYPNNSDDTAFHLAYFEKIAKGYDVPVSYMGREIIGYPLVWLERYFGISLNVSFFWFNYLVLWLIGISVFVLLIKTIDWKSGLIAIPLTMFVSASVLNLFDSGVIFDLITVGVIMPIFVLSVVYAITTRKIKWIVFVSILGIMAIVIHTMAAINISLNGKETPPSISMFVISGYYLGSSLSMIVLVLLIYVILSYKKLKLDKFGQNTLIVAGIVVIILAIITFCNITAWSTRVAIDLAIIICIFTSVLLGLVLKQVKDKRILLIIVAIILISSMPTIIKYFSYNSAITDTDKQVIAYINSIDGQYYSCSPQVAPWVYDRFLSKKYKEGELPYIYRNKPMTNRTRPGVVGYWWRQSTIGYMRKDYSKDVPDYNLDKALLFKDGALEIYIVEK